jgi:hypothetical protein
MSDQPKFQKTCWAVMFDSTHDEIGRMRHLVQGWDGDTPTSSPAIFNTRKEAEAHARLYYGYTLEPKNRKPPLNYRLPKPVRVRVTVEPI